MDSIMQKVNFGNEAGDDVQFSELEKYFVEQEGVEKYFEEKNRLAISIARKGEGKSALLKWISGKIEERDRHALVILCHGADLARTNFGLTNPLASPREYIRDWEIRLCSIINREIGKRIGFAGSDLAMRLVEGSEIDGYKKQNIIGALTERLISLYPGSELKKKGVINPIEALKQFGQKNCWLIIDDLDATFQKTLAEQTELATFFSACRGLFSISGINFRITLRTDVWATIRRHDESLDKVDQYVQEIYWPVNDFRKLLASRINSEIHAKGLTPLMRKSQSSKESDDELIDLVFEPRMVWGENQKRTYEVIHTLSYHRPRWGIQLCKLAQKRAVQEGDARISKKHLDVVWGEFGLKRISDLVAEHKHQCREVEEIINAFRGADRILTRDQLFSIISKKIVTHIAPTIDGVASSAPLQIAQFIYRIGFIVARSDEPGEFKDSYEHYHFGELPDILSSRTSDDFKLRFEIHPCYREALDIKKLDKAHRAERRRRIRK